MSGYSWLPKLLAEIAEVTDVETALTIARLRGGARMTIPSRVTRDHWLSRAVGVENASKLCHHFTSGYGSIEVEVPLSRNGARATLQRQIDDMLKADLSVEHIARRLGVSARQVRRRKKKLNLDLDTRQGTLFGRLGIE